MSQTISLPLCPAWISSRLSTEREEASEMPSRRARASACNLRASSMPPATLTMVNECSYTVSPVILSGAGASPLSTTGFSLLPSESKTIIVPPSWSGRIWGERTLCSQDSTGKFSCVTGDNGSTTQVATMAELILKGTEGLSFFGISLVNGFNLPMTVEPRGGNCSATGCGCTVELNAECPAELMVKSEGEVVACKSACQAFRDPLYCCVGAYGTPETCKPSVYSGFFKSACPLANVDGTTTSIFTFACASTDYLIAFGPAPSPSSDAAAVYNSGGQGDGSTNYVKVVASLVAAVILLICSPFAFKIVINIHRRNRETRPELAC